MSKNNIKKFIFYFLIISIVFVLDRVSKIYVINYFENTLDTEIYLSNFLNIILVWNEGIGFGLLSFQDGGIYNFITLIIILINLIIIYFIYKYKDIRSFLLTLVLGGSLGNLFDRIAFSAVPDFIDFNYNNFHWFIFNIADIFITIGVICLIFVELILNNKNLKNENE
jgi:signal peptidase II